MIEGLVALIAYFNTSLQGLITIPLVFLSVAAPFNARTIAEADLSKSVLLAKPPAPLQEATTLKIVTFNIQDLIVVGMDRPERMRAIGEVLTELDPDIVGMQESFVEPERQVLLDALGNSRLKYHQYYPSGTIGSGLLTLSAYPITEAFFHRYVQGGKWWKPYHGDWWAGKGVSLARIELPNGAGHVDFYDTHAQAGYSSPDEYVETRKEQMTELARFINASVTGTSPAFFVSDMNCSPGSAPFEIAVNEAKLERVMKMDTSIDHIFAVTNPRYAFEVIDTQPIHKIIPVGDRTTSLSDHTGYMSTVRIVPKER